MSNVFQKLTEYQKKNEEMPTNQWCKGRSKTLGPVPPLSTVRSHSGTPLIGSTCTCKDPPWAGPLAPAVREDACGEAAAFRPSVRATIGYILSDRGAFGPPLAKSGANRRTPLTRHGLPLPRAPSRKGGPCRGCPRPPSSPTPAIWRSLPAGSAAWRRGHPRLNSSL